MSSAPSVGQVQSDASAPPSPPLATVDCAARPFLYVVRFCGTEESSVASAIRQGVELLDQFLEARGAAAPDELVVVYRNRLEGAVALQIGFPVEQELSRAASGEVFAGITPSGSMVQLLPGGDLDDVLGAGAHFPEGAGSYTWQSFRRPQFRPLDDYPSAPLFAPAELAVTSAAPDPC